MRKDNSNDEVYDLSDMIDEYEEDSELRKKIEAMKQAQQNNDAYEANSTYEQEEEPQIYEAFTRKSYASQNEDSEEANVYEEADFDKTKVVMERPRYEEAEQEEADSVYLYDNHEVVEEEITEDDINEFLGENKQKKSNDKPSMDPEKMNKIVTIVIISIVSLCLIIGIGFGIKAMFFNSDETPVTDTDTNKDKDDNDKDDDEEKPIIDNPDDDEKDKPDENDNPVTDNTKEIAEIKGKIEANTKQINSYNKQIKDAQTTMKNNKINENDLYSKRTERDDTTRLIGNIAQELEDYKAQCSTDTESDFCMNFNEKAKLDEMNTLNQKLNTLNKDVMELEKKKQAYDTANAKITELNNEVTRLNNENKELQNKLSSLQ